MTDPVRCRVWEGVDVGSDTVANEMRSVNERMAFNTESSSA